MHVGSSYPFTGEVISFHLPIRVDMNIQYKSSSSAAAAVVVVGDVKLYPNQTYPGTVDSW